MRKHFLFYSLSLVKRYPRRFLKSSFSYNIYIMCVKKKKVFSAPEKRVNIKKLSAAIMTV